MKRSICLALVALAAGVGTWFAGWWAVPIVAFIAGAMRCGAAITALGCAAAWAALLAATIVSGNIAQLAGILGSIMGLPVPALVAVTIAFPALLGWSAASLGDAARSFAVTSRQPS
jgi:hypothetical protein